MTIQDKLPQSRVPPELGPAAASSGSIAHLVSFLRLAGGASDRRRVAILTVAVVVVICVNAVAQVRLNVWQGAVYDALGQRDVKAFVHELLVFLGIVAALLVLVVAQTWLVEMIKVRLREWLTHDLLNQWLMPKRAYLLVFAGEIGVNPDQRVHEDARHLTELSAELGIGLLQASLLLLSFVGVLWVLSEQVIFSPDGQHFAIPGYMVWCALAYALAGSWLTWQVGSPLIKLNAERYAREAELRFALVRISESAEGIALYEGEQDERRIVNPILDQVITVMCRLAGGLAGLTWITSGYGWLAIVVPLIAAAPGYFSGSLSLGGLMMVVGAFSQVQQALRWFIDNFSRIADWRATLQRILAFRSALSALEEKVEGAERIKVTAHPGGNLAFEHLSVSLPDGRAVLAEHTVEVMPGERVLLVGEPRAGKSTAFLAMAGLWPWGTGTVRLPGRGSLSFMPQRPYLPLGTLRVAVCYPADPTQFGDAAVHAVLGRVGLGRLVPLLDHTQRWDKDLELSEQQCLAFARLLLHQPQWVLIDDAMSALDDERRRTMLAIFERELAGAALIITGRTPAQDGFYTRTLHLLHLAGDSPVRIHPRSAETPIPRQI